MLEVAGNNVSTTFIACPADPKKTLGIKLPYLVMIIKNMKKYFSFEVTVLDDKGVHRRFRASNYQVGVGWGQSRPALSRLSRTPCFSRLGFFVSPFSSPRTATRRSPLAVHHESATVRVLHAHAVGRGVEPDPVQPR